MNEEENCQPRPRFKEEGEKFPEGCGYCSELLTRDNWMYLGGHADTFYHQSCWDQVSKRATELGCFLNWGPVFRGWKPTPPSQLPKADEKPSETAWEKAVKVLAEADKLEELIQLKLETPGVTREAALEWALEMRRMYAPKTEPTSTSGEEAN
jgi:hypothetical protein